MIVFWPPLTGGQILYQDDVEDLMRTTQLLEEAINACKPKMAHYEGRKVRYYL